jgi:hypothetical protein
MISPQTLPLMKPGPPSWLRRIGRWRRSGSGPAGWPCPCAAAADEQTFASPQDAVNALVVAAKIMTPMRAFDFWAGRTGIDFARCRPGHRGIQLFVQHLTEKTQLVTNSDSNVTLDIGADGWPFPIPLVKQDGQWFFDTAAAGTEILARRIGRDELGAMDVCNAYVEAQREYASQDRMGTACWPMPSSCAARPARTTAFSGRRIQGRGVKPVGAARRAGARGRLSSHAKMLNDQQAPYHGYYFKILTRQGKHAPGGKYNYIINGRMIAGFALVAWPAEWGNTGVMTFIVNQQGKVYQKNLGPKTAKIAGAMTTYDPDDTWTPAQ